MKGVMVINVLARSMPMIQGLATGSLFYVVFFEILEKERQKNVNGLLQVIHISSFCHNIMVFWSWFDDDDDAGGFDVCRLHIHGATRARRGSL